MTYPTNKFDFIKYSELEQEDSVYILTIEHDEKKYTVNYYPETFENYVISGEKYLTKEEYEEIALAAFCFFAVLLE